MFTLFQSLWSSCVLMFGSVQSVVESRLDLHWPVFVHFRVLGERPLENYLLKIFTSRPYIGIVLFFAVYSTVFKVLLT